MLMNGTADSVTPYQGGTMRLRSTILSSEASAWSLAERNGITVAPVTARLPNMRADDPTSVETLIWSVDGKPACCLYTIYGGVYVPQVTAIRTAVRRGAAALQLSTMPIL